MAGLNTVVFIIFICGTFVFSDVETKAQPDDLYTIIRKKIIFLGSSIGNNNGNGGTIEETMQPFDLNNTNDLTMGISYSNGTQNYYRTIQCGQQVPVQVQVKENTMINITFTSTRDFNTFFWPVCYIGNSSNEIRLRYYKYNFDMRTTEKEIIPAVEDNDGGLNCSFLTWRHKTEIEGKDSFYRRNYCNLRIIIEYLEMTWINKKATFIQKKDSDVMYKNGDTYSLICGQPTYYHSLLPNGYSLRFYRTKNGTEVHHPQNEFNPLTASGSITTIMQLNEIDDNEYVICEYTRANNTKYRLKAKLRLVRDAPRWIIIGAVVAIVTLIICVVLVTARLVLYRRKVEIPTTPPQPDVPVQTEPSMYYTITGGDNVEEHEPHYSYVYEYARPEALRTNVACNALYDGGSDKRAPARRVAAHASCAPLRRHQPRPSQPPPKPPALPPRPRRVASSPVARQSLVRTRNETIE